MPAIYPDKPPEASDGKAFELLGIRLHQRFLNETIEVFPDRRRQCTIGESPQGVEFKELKQSRDRFHIEVAEKASLNHAWVPSGITRNDNTTRYVCGNDQDIFAFRKIDLQQWRQINQPREVWYGRDCGLTDTAHALATIQSFVLPKNEAWLFCLYRFIQADGAWRIDVRDKAWMTDHLRQALGSLAETPIGVATIRRLSSSSLPSRTAIVARIKNLFGRLTTVEKTVLLAELQRDRSP